MLFKKHQPQTTLNLYDEHIMHLYNQLYDAWRTLETRTKEAYILSQSLAVYPNSPDKAFAQKQLTDKQHSVLCAIGHYDTLQANINQYRADNFDKLDKTKDWIARSNSHEVINQTIKKILEGELN